MKKVLLLVLAAGFLAACSSINKNTLSYKLSRYDQTRYYAVGGEGSTKEAAGENAKTNMRRAIEMNVVDVNTINVLDDVLSNARVDKVWRDKSRKDKHYLAIVTLEREPVLKQLAVPIANLDNQLGSLAVQFSNPTQKFADLKIVFRMQPLVVKRNVFEELYQFINFEGAGYNSEAFNKYKQQIAEKLAAIKVSLYIEGTQSEVLTSYIVNAVNELGLSPVLGKADDASLAVRIVTETDPYDSTRLQGLAWNSSSAAINLVDEETGGTFARFSVHERVGTSRAADSLRRSMLAVGEKAAPQVKEKLLNYLKTK